MHTKMLSLDLLGNGDGRPNPVKQEAIQRVLEGLGEPKRRFIQLCLQEDPSRRPKASSLLKHHVLQEVRVRRFPLCLNTVCCRILSLALFPVFGCMKNTPALLLKKSNVRKYSYLPTWNGGAPTGGIKRPIFDRVWYSRSPCPNRNGQGMKFTASVVQWLKNSYTWFQVCSYYSLAVMLD